MSIVIVGLGQVQGCMEFTESLLSWDAQGQLDIPGKHQPSDRMARDWELLD